MCQGVFGKYFVFWVSLNSHKQASKDEEVTEYFRYLQNQERLRAGEIINSLPDSTLEKYLDQISDKDEFFRIMTFSNKRRYFDRGLNVVFPIS